MQSGLPLTSSAPLLLLLMVLVAGCGPSGPQRYPVSGTVTFDGQPVADGFITFTPEGDDLAPDADKITDGKFEFEAQAGRKRVEILANRQPTGGQIDPVMNAVPLEQYIPPQYNSESTLSIEVKPDGENHFDFPLTSKP